MRQEWVGKRQAVRTTVQLRAQMRFEPGRPPVECTINDISLTGARLTVPDAGPYPDDFDIYIPARSETKWARVRWREDLQLGVEFLKGRRSDESSQTTAILSRLAALEKRTESSSAPGSALIASTHFDALAARLATLEQRSSLATSAEPSLAPHAGDAWLEAMLERTSEMEARLAALEAEVQRNDQRLGVIGAGTADLAQKIIDLSQSAFGPPSSQRAEDDQTGPLTVAPTAASVSIERRLSSLEAAATEVRGSLQALVLLLAAQISRSGRGP